MNIQTVFEDKRTKCLSSIISMTASNYLGLIERAYGQRGGIEGQRAPLKTKTGMRIRSRMVDDISQGAIIPPIVIGVVVDNDKFEEIKGMKSYDAVLDFLQETNPETLSIIDGMQRTTALYEAAGLGNIEEIAPVRIELWISKSVDRLIYRMLVLNTGQVPWDMKRQLQTIYQPIINEIRNAVPNISVMGVDRPERRTQPGQYQGHAMVEWFLVFSSRKTNVDLKEKVAEDFARLDATEATSDELFMSKYCTVLKLLSDIDFLFARLQPNNEEQPKIRSGREIFSSAPAPIGFVAAAAVFLFGPPGFNRSSEKVEDNLQLLTKNVSDFVKNMDGKGALELDLSGLNENLGRRSTKVGEFEREFYMAAFKALFQYGSELESMEPCWAAM